MHDDAARGPVVTVSGGAGYIGSVVVRELLERGHTVRVLDNLLFGDSSLTECIGHPGFSLVSGDVRARADWDRALAGAEAVLHLAGLVGDPVCALDPETTRAVNLESTEPFAEACRVHGVRRVVYASTCSVYGAAGDAWLNEDSPTAPVSLYAETNLRSEELLRERLGRDHALTVLRFATVFGVSPRMRFDLVVNLLAARAATTRRLEVHGGEQWRPQVHVRDVARALVRAVELPPETAAGTYNVGGTAQNLRVRDLAERVAAAFPGTTVTVQDVRDPRSYRVSFDRIERRFGFTPERDVDAGVREVAGWLGARHVDPEDPRYHNVRALEARLGRRAS